LRDIQKMGKNNLIILSLALLINSCSGYERLLKSSDYELKHRKAFEYYNKGDYVRASTLFDQIVAIYRGTNKADSLNYFQAMSYFHQDDYILAGHYFDSFIKIFGNSKFSEEANYYRAYCYYLISPAASLDQTNTIQALQAFQLFLIKYSDSKRTPECRTMINELRDKLVEKSYMSAKLYFDLEDYKASIVALNSSLIDYPESKYREEIMFFILKSSFLLAYNSIEKKQKERYQATIDEYYSFIAEFPDSKYIKEAEKIFENSTKVLNTDITKIQLVDGL